MFANFTLCRARMTFQDVNGQSLCLHLGMTGAGFSLEQGAQVADRVLIGYRSIILVVSMTCVTIPSSIQSSVAKVVIRGDIYMHSHHKVISYFRFPLIICYLNNFLRAKKEDIIKKVFSEHLPPVE